MKRLILVLGFLLIFPMTFSSPSQAAQIRPGAACTKVGQVVVQGQKKFTCVRQKKKLIWNKGVPFAWNTDNGIPKNDNINAQKQVLFNALAAIRSFQMFFSSNAIPQQSIVEPGFNETTYKKIDESYSWALSQWATVFPSDIRFAAVYANSAQFVLDSLSALGEVRPTRFSPFLNSAYPDYAVGLARPLWAFSTHINEDPRKPVIVYLAYPNYQSRLNGENAVHEVFHAVQAALDPTLQNLPCWIREGQASVFGLSYDARPDASESSVITAAKYGGYPTETGVDLKSIESASDWKQGGSCAANGQLGEYAQGMVANAYLIHRYGVQKQFDFLRSMKDQKSDGITWRETFEKTFGIPVDTFYSDAAVYMRWYYSYYYNKAF